MDSDGELAGVREDRGEARSFSLGRSWWLVWGTALAMWLLKAAFVLTRPIQSLAKTPYLIDDGFIGMQIAYNLSRGQGYTFDGVSATTGAPPLWTWLTMPLHLLFDKKQAAQATILLAAAMAGLCTVLVFRICRRLFGLPSAYAAFSLASLSFPLFFQSLNGMETFFFATIGLLVTQLVLVQRSSHVRSVWLGLLLGMLVWIRADGIFLGLLLVGWEAALGIEGRRREHLGQTLVMAMLMFGLTALLLIWSRALSGRWLPSNQRGRYWIAHGYWTTWDWHTYVRMCIGNVWMFLQLYRITLGSVALVIIAGIGMFKHMGRRWQGKVLPFVMYILLMVFMYAFYQWYFPDVHGLRYIVYPALILTVMVGGAVGWTGDLIEQWCGTLVSRGAMTLLVVGIVTLTAVNYKRMVDGLCWTKWDWLLGVPASGLSEAWCEERWVEEHVPPGGVLAAKDIGRLTYFTHSRIVDLAGIIKPDVIESIRERDLASYIVDQGATHVITVRDPTYYLNQALDLSDRRFEGIEDFCPHSHYVLYGVRQNR